MKTVFRSGRWAIALVVAVLGFMLSTQFRVQQQLSLSSNDVTLARSQALTVQVTDLNNQNDALTKQVADLRSQLAKATAGASGALADQLRTLHAEAGLTDMLGQGVVVTMDDAKRPVGQGENANAFIIHDQDVLLVVNELLAAQAEAVSINGQRLVDRTAIRCAGATIMINGIATAPPLEIRAIGDARTLQTALELKGGVIDSLRYFGIQVSIQRSDKVLVPAYNGNLTYRYANPQGGK